MKSPFFSVILTTYNRANLLPRAINSVMNQTLKNFELIVVDDCSIDNTPDVMKRYHNNKIKYVRNKQNLKLAEARNIGIKKSNGKWILFLDDDDEFTKDRLEEVYNQIIRDKNTYKVYFCRDGSNGLHNDSTFVIYDDIWKLLMKGWTPPSSAQCFHIDALKKINYLDTDILSGIDHDIWFKLGKHGFKTGIIKKGLAKYHYLQTPKRMIYDYSHRLNGIEEFLAKWKNLIIKRESKKFFWKFYNHLLCVEHRRFAYSFIKKSHYLKSIKHIILSLRYNPRSTNTWKCIIYFMLGTRLYNMLKKIYLTFNKKREHKQMYYIDGLN